jgi:hypothetical protein
MPGAKRNRGHDPIYKEIDRATVPHFKRAFPKIVPDVDHAARTKPTPNPELSESVRRYLAARNASEIEAKKSPIVIEHDYAGARPTRDLREGLEKSSVSHRDIVIELYLERKLNIAELQAARMWQHYMEEMCLQPPISCDPSGYNGYQYQADGEISQSQYDAMVCRRIAESALGRPNRIFLDAILQPDIGRASISRSRFTVEAKLKSLLMGLAIFFGYSRGDTEYDQRFVTACAERLDRKYDSTTRAMENQKRSVSGWHREFNRLDSQIVREL